MNEHTGKSLVGWSGDWADVIPQEEWRHQEPVIREARARGIPFVIGGGLAFSDYSGRVRFSKDIDLFVQPEDREKVIEITRTTGLRDYFEVLPYDRSWIYRAYAGDAIVDTIWSFPNHRTDVRPEWLRGGKTIQIRGTELPLLRAEDLLWTKLYVMQRERCDWPDLLNLLQSSGDAMDWDYLIAVVEADLPILASLLSLFGWLSPCCARSFPADLWSRLGIPAPVGNEDDHRRRVPLLDTRDWFGPTSGPRETAASAA